MPGDGARGAAPWGLRGQWWGAFGELSLSRGSVLLLERSRKLQSDHFPWGPSTLLLLCLCQKVPRAPQDAARGRRPAQDSGWGREPSLLSPGATPQPQAAWRLARSTEPQGTAPAASWRPRLWWSLSSFPLGARACPSPQACRLPLELVMPGQPVLWGPHSPSRSPHFPGPFVLFHVLRLSSISGGCSGACAASSSPGSYWA